MQGNPQLSPVAFSDSLYSMLHGILCRENTSKKLAAMKFPACMYYSASGPVAQSSVYIIEETSPVGRDDMTHPQQGAFC